MEFVCACVDSDLEERGLLDAALQRHARAPGVSIAILDVPTNRAEARARRVLGVASRRRRQPSNAAKIIENALRLAERGRRPSDAAPGAATSGPAAAAKPRNEDGGLKNPQVDADAAETRSAGYASWPPPGSDPRAHRVRDDTSFQVGDLSKTIAAAFALDVFARHDVDVDGSANAALRRLNAQFVLAGADGDHTAAAWAERATIAQLMDHTVLGALVLPRGYVSDESRRRRGWGRGYLRGDGLRRRRCGDAAAATRNFRGDRRAPQVRGPWRAARRAAGRAPAVTGRPRRARVAGRARARRRVRLRRLGLPRTFAARICLR